MFIDDFRSMNAYNAVGFKRSFMQTFFDTEELWKLNLTTYASSPLSPGQWLSWMRDFTKMAPFEKNTRLGMKNFTLLPDGGLRLGGTFVVKGNDVIYQWNDLMPGDHPNIEEVLSIAKEAALEEGAPQI
eukprot:gnl/TRDRNA2_/TRDRNA2_51309_c0_seq1.p2 gnl/TRDRNA2_/TRDRNA2_51309_c0~~gnl/TRDRNA2_/TRDRNA2_51309_c0_seq1.p2  ORF type:complete len:129 (-),score=31.01 gnl/TRDRNA2_/TRDRNA2_51309_c0_seq1:274-660(-)